MVFPKKINARSVNLDDGDGSVVNLNRRNGKNAATVTIVAQTRSVLTSNFIPLLAVGVMPR